MAKEVDWEGVERDYRPNTLSLREIGKKYGVSESMIRKKAGKEGWTRNLTAKINARAEELVRKEEVRRQVRTENAEAERSIIEANATAIVQVKLAHRGDIRRYRNLANTLLEELEDTTRDNDLFRQLGELLQNPDERGDRLNTLYRKVIDMPNRVDSLNKLASALKVLVALEREAYGMDRDDDDGRKSVAEMTHDELDRRIAKLSAA